MSKTKFYPKLITMLLISCMTLGNVQSVFADENTVSNTSATSETKEADNLSAETYEDFQYISDGDGNVSIVGYTGHAKTLQIPSTINDQKVVKIGAYAFERCETITSVYIPATVKLIEEYAFDECTALETVNLKEGLEEIDDYAFMTCSNIRNITLPASVQILGEGVFFHCMSLQSVKLSKELNSMGDYAFAFCTSLEKVNTAGLTKLREIPKEAFDNCSALKEFTFPKGCKKVGESAFSACSALEKIENIEYLSEIESNAFANVHAQDSISLNCTEVKEDIFSGVSVDTLILGRGVETLKENALDSMNIGKLCISASLETIEDNALANSNIEEMEIEDGSDSFAVKDSVLYSKDFTKLYKWHGEDVMSDDLEMTYYSGDMSDENVEENKEKNAEDESSVQEADTEDIYHNFSKDEIPLVEDHDYVYDELSENDNSLAEETDDEEKVAESDSETVNESNVSETVDESAISEDADTADESAVSEDADTADESAVSEDTEAEEDYVITIPDTVKEIGNYAFPSKLKVSEVIIPDAVEKIDDNAFKASKIKTISVPDQVTYLGVSVFESCEQLQSVSLGDGIEEIPENTFSDDTELSELSYSDQVKTIKEYAFQGDSSLQELHIGAGVKDIDASAFLKAQIESFDVDKENQYFQVKEGCLISKEKKTLVEAPYTEEELLTVPAVAESLGSYSCGMVDSETKIVVEEGIKYIEENAFFYQESPRVDEVKTENMYIKLPDSIEELDENAISQKSNLLLVSENENIKKYAKENDIAYATEIPEIADEEITLKGNETYEFEVKGLDTSGIVYTSTDPSIASVDDDGVITGRKKGSTYICAAEGLAYFVLKVEVTSDGEAYEPLFNAEDYVDVPAYGYNHWVETYTIGNSDEDLSAYSNPCCVTYSGSEYYPMKCLLKDGPKDQDSSEETDDDLSRYKKINENLSYELSRYTMEQNTLVYSGTANVDAFTDTSSSIGDMKNSIGKKDTFHCITSTSVNYEVTKNFGSGYYCTLLMIYVPEGYDQGAYISAYSDFMMEYEYLLDTEMDYEIMDAGVRIVEGVDEISGESEIYPERYLALRLISA